MYVSDAADMAIRILLELAEIPRFRSQALSAPVLAERWEVPVGSIRRLLPTLRDHGWLEVTRGVLGGFSLRVPPDRISVWDVIVVVDGERASRPCLLEENESCWQAPTCSLRNAFLKADLAFNGTLCGVSIARLVEEERFLVKLICSQRPKGT